LSTTIGEKIDIIKRSYNKSKGVSISSISSGLRATGYSSKK